MQFDKLVQFFLKTFIFKASDLTSFVKNLIEILYFKNAPHTKINKIYPYSNGYTHISLTVKDIFKIYKFLKKEKIKFNSKPEKSQDGKVFMTYCKTPEGGYLELVQEKYN